MAEQRKPNGRPFTRPPRLRSATRAVATQRARSREVPPVDGPANVNANAASTPEAADTSSFELSASDPSVPRPHSHALDNVLCVFRDAGARDKQATASGPPRGIKRPSAPTPILIKASARSFTPETEHNDLQIRSTEAGSEVQGNRTSHGHYCSQEKSDRVNTWVNEVAPHGELYDSAIPIEATANVYKDWLDWSKETALSWLRRLDRYEQRLRTASLKYHKLPYEVRHSSKILYGSSVEQVVLNRLSAILETDRARPQQAFFHPWFEVKNVAANVLEDMKFYQPLPDDCEFLRTILRKFELSLFKMPKACRTLIDGLQWLEDAVAAVLERSDLDGGDALASPFTREGGILRGWIQTLPELDSEVVEMKSRYTEWYVDRLLDIGVEADQYWSSLVDISGSKGESSRS
jgi:hypothetical protein